MNPHRLHRAMVFSGITAVCLTSVLACESEQPTPNAADTGDFDPSPNTPDTTQPPVEAAGRTAVDAYLGMWHAMAVAGETSDWRSPDLARFATGNALTTITRSLYADHFNHVVTRGMPKNDPKITSVAPEPAPSTVMLSDCGDSSKWLKYREGTADLMDNEPGGRQDIVAEVTKQPDGTWRVNRFAVQGVGTC